MVSYPVLGGLVFRLVTVVVDSRRKTRDRGGSGAALRGGSGPAFVLLVVRLLDGGDVLAPPCFFVFGAYSRNVTRNVTRNVSNGEGCRLFGVVLRGGHVDDCGQPLEFCVHAGPLVHPSFRFMRVEATRIPLDNDGF